MLVRRLNGAWVCKWILVLAIPSTRILDQKMEQRK